MSKEAGCLMNRLDALDALTDAVDRWAPLVAAVALWALRGDAAIFVGLPSPSSRSPPMAMPGDGWR